MTGGRVPISNGVPRTALSPAAFLVCRRTPLILLVGAIQGNPTAWAWVVDFRQNLHVFLKAREDTCLATQTEPGLVHAQLLSCCWDIENNRNYRHPE